MRGNRGFSGTQIALAFLGGAAAGTAVAIMTAPKSGREMRKELGCYFRRAKQLDAQLPETIAVATSKARKAFEHAMADVESKLMH